MPYAAGIARRAGAALQVVEAHVPVAALYSGCGMSADFALDASIRESEGAYLDGVVKRLMDKSPASENEVLIDGPERQTRCTSGPRRGKRGSWW